VFIAALFFAVASPVRLPPVEQCNGDPEFVRVRQELEETVRSRDLEGLLSLTSTDVRVSFGGRFGHDGFRQHWASTPEDRALLWKELGRALRLGCARGVDGGGKEYRAMPAMFITGGNLDGFTTWVAMPGAVLRSRQKESAPVRMRLPAWTVLEEAEHAGGSWIEARTPKGRRGYVSTAQARSLLDYRIVFGRRDGFWRITAFIAGD
jgi:hypothetical protein